MLYGEYIKNTLMGDDWYDNGLVDALDNVHYFTANYVSTDDSMPDWDYRFTNADTSTLIDFLIKIFLVEDSSNMLNDEVDDNTFLTLSKEEQEKYIKKSIESISNVYDHLDYILNTFLETLDPEEFYGELD